LGAVDADNGTGSAMNIRGILFDKDGTLVDFNRTWLRPYQRAAAFLATRFGVDAGELMARGGYLAESNTWRADSPLAAGSNAAIIECWSAVVGEAITGDDLRTVESMFHLSAEDYAPAVEDLAALLVELRGGDGEGDGDGDGGGDGDIEPRHPRVLLSGGGDGGIPSRHPRSLLSGGGAGDGGIKLGVATMDGEDNARRMLRAAGVDLYFDFVCGADSGYGLKPAAGMARAFCDACDLQPAQMMLIGDSPKDVNMGINAGAGFTVGVLTGAHTADDLSSADRILNSIAEVPALLRELRTTTR